MNDKRKDQTDLKGHPKNNCPQQMKTHNVPTDDMENANGINQGGIYSIN